MAMKPEWKKPWVEALRSGEYKQCQGFLKAPRGEAAYCCLGVLQDVCGKAGLHVAEDGDAYLLEVDMAKELLGITQLDQEGLSLRNDGGETFLEIADYIEQKL